jgi:two-component system chemotaxis response regulator CheY
MKSVLVVDDSPVVRHFHMNILKSSGFQADGASDGVEALEKALLHPYDVILCDINMPNMDGLSFIRRYRQEEKETPIIIMTTQEEAVHREKGFAAGANLYIVKPVKPQTLILHLQMLMGGRHD